MASKQTLFILSISVLFNVYHTSSIDVTSSIVDQANEDLEDDIAFLESQENIEPQFDLLKNNYENYDDLEDSPDSDQASYPPPPAIDDKDVVVLKKDNFSEFIEQNKYVMVEFYAPWCGHCQALALEYAAAATALKDKTVLAKVDATEEDELATTFDIKGFPTLLFFIDGIHSAYEGARNEEAIVNWVKKKTGPAVYNVTTTEEAASVLAANSKIVLGYLDSLVGRESEELGAAARSEDDDVNFYQTASPEVAKLFNMDPLAQRRPSLVLLKKEPETFTLFDGEFSKTTIAEFVSANKLPLVVPFSSETASIIFDHSIRRQVLLFATSSDSQQLIPMFQDAAKSFKGKIIFVYVAMDDEDQYKKHVINYFGVAGDVPRVLAYIANDDANKYSFDGELTLTNVKSFAEDFVEDKLKLFYKSDPIPRSNDGDVKIVVGYNFDEIVLDESKDVLLEIYAPWCGHCKALEPTYNKLGNYLRGIDSLVIAKMDGTTNEHPRAKPNGYPTLLFFPAGNKSFDPIKVETDRTVVAFYKFLKKHASIPFKLQKPASKLDDSKAIENQESSSRDVKDEL